MRQQLRGPTTFVRAAGTLAATLAMLVVAGTGTAGAIGLTDDGAPADSTDDSGSADGAGTEDEGEDGEGAGVDDEVLVVGAETYSQICSSCHQPGGAGLPGQYPPLIDNPNVDDADYVRDVIDNGRQGEIEVAGEIYNGVMPSFSTLDDDDVEAVIAYIQSGFAAPEVAQEEFQTTGPVAGTELPVLADAGYIIAYLLAASIIALVLAPRLIGANDRLETPWLDAWLKTATIVLAIVFLTVVLPNWLLQTEAVAELDRSVQDLIGASTWGVGLIACLVALGYAHRDSRI